MMAAAGEPPSSFLDHTFAKDQFKDAKENELKFTKNVVSMKFDRWRLRLRM